MIDANVIALAALVIANLGGLTVNNRAFNAKFAGLREYIDVKFKSIDRRLDGLDKRLDDLPCAPFNCPKRPDD